MCDAVRTMYQPVIKWALNTDLQCLSMKILSFCFSKGKKCWKGIDLTFIISSSCKKFKNLTTWHLFILNINYN